jgi:hypothetical protein
MPSLVVLYDMHTDYFLRAIEGISSEDAHQRLNTKANHISWLAGSLIEQRFEIAKSLGVDRRQSAHDLFKDGKGIQDNITYPSLEDYKKDWNSISPELRKLYLEISDEKLDSRFEIHKMEMSNYELITFMIYREANCIGQIALWRRLLGYDAIKYD